MKKQTGRAGKLVSRTIEQIRSTPPISRTSAERIPSTRSTGFFPACSRYGAGAGITLAQRLAQAKGLPHQSYIKSLLHEALERERLLADRK